MSCLWTGWAAVDCVRLESADAPSYSGMDVGDRTDRD